MTPRERAEAAAMRIVGRGAQATVISRVADQIEPEISAAVAEARRLAIEECAQWHEDRAEEALEAENVAVVVKHVPRLSLCEWHQDCAADIRALLNEADQ